MPTPTMHRDELDATPAPQKVLIVCAEPRSLLNFRGHLLGEMVRRGHAVVAVGDRIEPEISEGLANLGVRYVPVAMQRTGTNPLRDLGTARALTSLCRRERPNLVFAYTAKPVVYGGLAARLAGVDRFYALITGLGSPFAPVPSLRRRVIRHTLEQLYRISLSHASAVIFQNRDDRELFQSRGLVPSHTSTPVVAGSGVDTAQFGFAPVPETEPTRFLLMSRLIREKGIEDYVAASRLLRERGVEARMGLLGPVDHKPSSISLDEVRQWESEGLVEYLGEHRDVRPFLRDAHVFVLPTFYREGVPRSILEALSIGRAIVTTDSPGCRDTVVPNENGILVPPQDPAALADALQALVEDPKKVQKMGEASRALAESRFAVQNVTADVLHTLGL